jgi:tRNA nucleotidyltransferase (CCA-adding enzyme)
MILVNVMLDVSKELLEKIEECGFEAYIVGGFVRDYYMGKKTLDVDICTNATPKDLNMIFKEALLPTEKYGAVTIIYKKVRFEITTYRKELNYEDNRHPEDIQYIYNLMDDLNRRDFTINTLCMNSKGEIIDLLGGKKDIDNKVIRMVNNPDIKMKEDVLRILRAIRFATILNFKLDDSVKGAIIKYRDLLKKLSYTRKKEELTRILTSSNAKYGIKLLCELELDKALELSNLSNIKLVDDILGIWAELNIIDIYPFRRAERDIILHIDEILDSGVIDSYTLYKYDLYATSIAASIKGINKKEINNLYKELPIKSRSDIKLDIKSLCSILNRKPGSWIKDIYDDIEKKIIYKDLLNDNDTLRNYIIKNY